MTHKSNLGLKQSFWITFPFIKTRINKTLYSTDLDQLQKGKIWIVKNRAMGDALLALTAMTLLKQLAPALNITYVIPKWLTPLFKKIALTKPLTTPYDEVLPLSLKNLKDWWETFFTFIKLMVQKEGRPLFIYEFHQSGRTSTFFQLLSAIARVPYFAYNHHLTAKSRLPASARDLQGLHLLLSTYFLHLNNKYIEKLNPSNYLDHPKILKISNSHLGELQAKNKRYFLLGVTATRATKVWPINYFVTLMKLILLKEQEFYKSELIHFIIPFSNSENDKILQKELQEELQNQLQNGLLFNRFTLLNLPLEELVPYFERATLFIGNDSGLKHLAAHLGVRTFTFFGPEEPYEWHPYQLSDHPIFYIPDLDCRTKTLHFCPLNSCDHHTCLKDLYPEKIFELMIKKYQQFLFFAD